MVDISRGESVELGFEKDVPRDPLKYVKTAVAFANTRGGTMLFGVDNARTIVGIGDPYTAADDIMDTIMSMTEPQIPLDSYVEDINGKPVVAIRVEPGRNRPYFISSLGPVDGTFVRVGATSRRAGEERLRDLMSQNIRASFDSAEYIGEHDPEDVEAVRRMLSESIGREIVPENLVGMGLLADTPTGRVPTNGLMMLTSNPFGHAMVRCVRFRGCDKDMPLDTKDFGGDLMSQIHNATAFVLNYLPLSSRLEGIYRRDRYELPEAAVRELVMNAVVHRSYTDVSSFTFVFLYDDRLEIVSPGPMPMGMTVSEAFSGRSKARNPALARFFREMGLTEGFGSGLTRVARLCREWGLDDPVVTDDGDCVKAIIRRNSGATYLEPPTDREMELLGHMEDDPGIGLEELSGRMGVSRATVSRMVRALKDRGFLRREGAKNNGRWRVYLRSAPARA